MHIAYWRLIWDCLMLGIEEGLAPFLLGLTSTSRVIIIIHQRSSYGAEFCGCPWQGSGKGGAKLKRFRHKAGREDN